MKLQVPLDQQFVLAAGGFASFLDLTKSGMGFLNTLLFNIVALLPEEVRKNTQIEMQNLTVSAFISVET